MAQVRLNGVTHHYPGVLAPSLVGIDLTVADGEIVTVIGPSGSGKSTLIRLVAGLERPISGQVLIGEHDVTDIGVIGREVGVVGAFRPLLPHMSVRENVTFSLTASGLTPTTLAARFDEVASAMEIGDLAGRFPAGLTRGQTHAVHLARALIRPSKVLVLDDPLAGLDPVDRQHARYRLASLLRRRGATVLFITHDQREAMSLGDRMIVLLDGVLAQVAPPLEVYRSPRNLDVARFVGNPPVNTLRAVVTSEGAVASGLLFPVPSRLATEPGDRWVVGVRPEAVRLLPRGAEIRVTAVELTGSDANVTGELGHSEGDRQRLTLRCRLREAPRLGETVHVDVLRDDEVLFFDPVTGRRR